MSLHQIIYTSCRCGIKGAGDGLQVFSHDRQFPQQVLPDLQSMFSYSHPRLPAGQAMTDELAEKMPASFFYRFLRDGSCAIAQNTYLGHDYMGKTGRFGNYMSHVILFRQQAMPQYPCEFWHSSMLRSSMSSEEVNNPEVPDYLPAPEASPGEEVNLASVTSFLQHGDRLAVYKHMLAAMLDFRREKKRLLIVDEAENIIFWIAALQYALPLQYAQRINFNTYEYNPDNSLARICGVLEEGTRFSLQNAAQHYVFNMKTGSYPSFAGEGFLELAAGAFGSEKGYAELLGFHKFLLSDYDFYLANEKIYDAYRLYARLAKKEALEVQKLDRALSFAADYGKEASLHQLVQTILQELMKVEDLDKFSCLTNFLAKAGSKINLKLAAQLKAPYVNMIKILFEQARGKEEFEKKISLLHSTGKDHGLEVDLLIKEGETFAFLADAALRSGEKWRADYLLGSLQDKVGNGKQELEEILAYRASLVFDLIKQGFRQAAGIVPCHEVMKLLHAIVKGRPCYIDEQFAPLSGIYYERLAEFGAQESFPCKAELLGMMDAFSCHAELADRIIADLLQEMTYSELSQEHQDVLDLIDRYVNNQKMQCPGRLKMLQMGSYLQGCKEGKAKGEEIGKWLSGTLEGQDDALPQYFRWIVPEILRVLKSKTEQEKFISKLQLPAAQKQMFDAEWKRCIEANAGPVERAVKNVAKVLSIFKRR